MVPDGETVLFAEDALVIVPGPDTAVDVAMQYRVFGYSGATPPSLDWQDAMHVTWRGEAQWCFMLPRGRMSVEVRAVNRVSGGVSGSSEAMKFLVKGMVLVVAKKLQSEFHWCARRQGKGTVAIVDIALCRLSVCDLFLQRVAIDAAQGFLGCVFLLLLLVVQPLPLLPLLCFLCTFPRPAPLSCVSGPYHHFNPFRRIPGAQKVWTEVSMRWESCVASCQWQARALIGAVGIRQASIQQLLQHRHASDGSDQVPPAQTYTQGQHSNKRQERSSPCQPLSSPPNKPSGGSLLTCPPTHPRMQRRTP